jgi:hypothetical protein
MSDFPLSYYPEMTSKIKYLFLVLVSKINSVPLISMEDWLQNTPPTSKSVDVQVLYVKLQKGVPIPHEH